MNLEKNMGKTDRTIRLAVAGLLVLIGIFTNNIVFSIIGLILLATATTRVCPGYMPFGISTKDKEEERGA